MWRRTGARWTEADDIIAPKVAIDARSLQQAPLGGVGRVLANVLPLLAEHIELSLLLDARHGRAVSAPGRQYPLKGRLTGRGVEWLQLAAPSWLRGFDGVFHCPFYGLPYWQPVPSVVTIHDISFETYPHWFSRAQRAVFRAQARHAARTARCVITVSEVARTQIIERYKVDASRIIVSRNAADPVFRPTSAGERDEILSALGVQGRYLIAMGGAARRGLDISLGAWRGLRRLGVETSMVVVGAADLEPEAGLVRAGRVSDADFSLLLGGAEAFCYPTAYEGFGLPALEAIATGTPVVCPRVGALAELLGDAAIWAEDRTVDAFEGGLRQLLDDPARSATLRRISLERAGQARTWKDAAAAHLRAYQIASDGS